MKSRSDASWLFMSMTWRSVVRYILAVDRLGCAGMFGIVSMFAVRVRCLARDRFVIQRRIGMEAMKSIVDYRSLL